MPAADNRQGGAEDASNDVAVRSHENDSRSREDSVPPLMPHEAAEHAHDGNDDMPSLVTSDDSEGDSLPDLNNSDADSFPQEDHSNDGKSLPGLDSSDAGSFPQSHYNSGASRLPGLEADPNHHDGDNLPSLDNSDADGLPQEHYSGGISVPDLEADHDGDSLPDLDNSDGDSFPQEHYGSDGDSLPGLEADHDCGSEGSEAYEDAEDSDDYEETDELPALVDFPPPTFVPAVNGAQAFGPNTPLDLDQQAAVDDLSHELDVADALAASVRLVRSFYPMTFQLCVTLCIAVYGVRPVQLSQRSELHVYSAAYLLPTSQANLMLSS